MSIAASARAVGMSKEWGYKTFRGLGAAAARHRKDEDELPNPKDYADLDGGVKDTLKDFNLFRKVFLCRDDVPWAKAAAERVVSWLLNEDGKDFSVMNEPPGSGKTTMFTHDIPLWLICGGGFEDPKSGRAIRLMLGSDTKNVSIHYVKRLRNSLGMTRPYYDRDKQLSADISLVEAFGRFKPQKSYGEDSVWKQNEFIVAQVTDMDLYEKEPTVQAASRESGFLGERCNLAVWDDLATNRNCRNADVAEGLSQWFVAEAETRIEPGGLLLLVGQRLGNLDLYRNRLDAQYIDESGVPTKKYHHVVFPAHDERNCPSGGELTRDCTQSDVKGTGCLLDAKRLTWRDLLIAQSNGDFRTVYQQEDANPEDILVQPAWIHGGRDADGWEAPGCLDRERAFWEWPDRPVFTYATVDPSASRWWAIEVWALDLMNDNRYLIAGIRRKMRAGSESGFLDWDNNEQKHVGIMEELQLRTGEAGHPISLWIVEAMACQRFLLQTNAFETWRRKWNKVQVMPHMTNNNKSDEQFGVEAAMGMAYKLGLKRLPYSGHECRAYLEVKINELTKYPMYPTDDTVMSDWFGEYNMRRIRQFANELKKWDEKNQGPANLPAYLARQTKEYSLR